MHRNHWRLPGWPQTKRLEMNNHTVSWAKYYDTVGIRGLARNWLASTETIRSNCTTIQ
jgi:hypothetical protein